MGFDYNKKFEKKEGEREVERERGREIFRRVRKLENMSLMVIVMLENRGKIEREDAYVGNREIGRS